MSASGDGSMIFGTQDGRVIYLGNNGDAQKGNSSVDHSWILSVFITPNGYLLASTEGDGVFYSVDSGRSWERLHAGLASADISFLTTSEKGTLYAGSEIDGGIFVTSDRGSYWDRIDSGLANPVTTAIGITSKGNILASIGGINLRSTDGGRRWMTIDSGLRYQFNRFYTFNCFANGDDGSLFGGTSGGVFRSIDDGISWAQVDSGHSITSLAVDRSGLIFATDLVDSAGYGSIYSSIDGGATWSKAFRDLSQISSYGDSIKLLCLAVAPNNHVFAGSLGAGIFRSIDSGATWNAMNRGLSDLGILALAADSSGKLFAGTNSGVFRSIDDGNDWTPYTKGMPNVYVDALAADATSTVYAATDVGVFRTVATSSVGLATEADYQHACSLDQNSPNPFPRSTTISFTLPAASYISLNLFDATGREVARIASGYFAAGEHEVPFARGNLPAGVYFYRLEANGSVETRAMVIEE